MKNFFTAVIALALCMGMLLGVSSCGAKVRATDLLSLIMPNTVSGKASDDKFAAAYTEFAKKLCAGSDNGDENVLISPLSVMLALSMTANGADGTTRSQMETVLGGDISLSELNEYLYKYAKNLYNADNCKLNIANSIWLREGIEVKNPFLQDCADYYAAQLYREPFNRATVNKINLWVRDNTDKMIDKIIDSINADSMMYLINAIAFDAKWETKFEDTKKDIFTNSKGEKENVTYLCDERHSGYFELDGAKGIALDYKGGRYSFVAILPNDADADINGYFTSLDAKSLITAIKSAKNDSTAVDLRLPQFKFDYTTELGTVLSKMGMPTAFTPAADFSKISDEPLAIGNVIHKTYIEVDKEGTKAAAVTAIDMKCTSAAPAENPTELFFDRPFIFMIADNETGMPIFVGTLATAK